MHFSSILNSVRRAQSFICAHSRYGLLILLSLFLLAEVVILVTPTTYTDEVSLNESALNVLTNCKDAPHRPTCYEKEVPKLLSSISMEAAFDVVREIQQLDPSYRFCHVLAHELGGLEVAKDPAQWFNTIPRCPSDGLCSNGCVHGAAVERFSTEVLSDAEIEIVIPDLSIACEAREGYNPTPLDQAMCYHGIGHMGVHITKARVEKSLEICDRVAEKGGEKSLKRLCDEGVFMQLFQPLEPEDYALVDQLPVTPTRENLSSFCDQNGRTSEERGACWREGWPFYREDIKTAEGIVSFCATSENDTELDHCYSTVLSIVGRTSLNGTETAQNLCANLPEQWQGKCFSIAAGAILEEDRSRGADAVTFCSNAPSESNQIACYDRLVAVATFIFHPTDTKLRQLCAALPAPWRGQCTAQML